MTDQTIRPAKPKKTDEQRLADQRRRAEKATARALDTERKLEERKQRKHARVRFLLGEWLDARMRQDLALQKLVEQTLCVTQESDEESLQTYWKGVHEVLELGAVSDAGPAATKTASASARSASPSPNVRSLSDAAPRVEAAAAASASR